MNRLLGVHTKKAMQRSEINKTFRTFSDFMRRDQLKDALGALELVRPVSAEFADEIAKISDTYHNVLKYTFLGIDDPQRSKIHQGLKLSLFELSDRIRHKLLISNQSTGSFQYTTPEKPFMDSGTTLRQLFESYMFDAELKDIFAAQDAAWKKASDAKEAKAQLINHLFRWLIMGGKLSENDKVLVQKVLDSERFEWHDKCLIISAVTLGLLQTFDVFRFGILFDSYTRNEMQIAQRAFTGLLLGLYLYDDRLYLYPQLLNRLRAIQGDEALESNARAVIFQLMKAKDTEKVTKKFQDEIMPEIVKNAPGLEDRLGLNQIISADPLEDKNPNWKKFLEDSPDLINKLEEVTRMQLEGMDVFMSTFANLKHFPFFNQLINWFLPFHMNHPLVENTLSGEEQHFRNVFIDGLSRSQYMCNSDKFSFCMSLSAMPSRQKEMMTQMFAAEVEGMKELEKEEAILDAEKKPHSIYTQYIQDLYRFFKLHPGRQNMDDIFGLRFDFHNKEFTQHIITGNSSWKVIADFYFNSEYYNEAVEIFTKIHENGDQTQELFEKLAYCYEKLNNYSQAIAFYKKAELFDQNRLWNLRRIARVQWLMQKYSESITSYKEAEQLDPDNLHLQTTIGNCYLQIRDYINALNYYYKVELQSPENEKVLRPIAWCLFVTGKFTEARHYFERLMEKDPNKYDYMNLGHVLMCINQKEKAIECYLHSIRQLDNSIKQFMAGFEDDKIHLIRHGVNPEELPLLTDYLKYLSEGSQM